MKRFAVPEGSPWAKVNSAVRLLMLCSVPLLFMVCNISVVLGGILLAVCLALGICSALSRAGKNLRGVADYAENRLLLPDYESGLYLAWT